MSDGDPYHASAAYEVPAVFVNVISATAFGPGLVRIAFGEGQPYGAKPKFRTTVVLRVEDAEMAIKVLRDVIDGGKTTAVVRLN